MVSGDWVVIFQKAGMLDQLASIRKLPHEAEETRTSAHVPS
jgi:hypothetical protein